MNTKCGRYTHGSLFTLLYLSINISRCIQKPEWCTGMYNETHQIQITLITNCGIYAYGSLFTLLYLGVNISRRTCTGKSSMYNETHQVSNTNTASINTVPCTLLHRCILRRSIQKRTEIEFYLRKFSMYIG